LDLNGHSPEAPVLAVRLEATGETAHGAGGVVCSNRSGTGELELTLARLRGLVGEGMWGRRC